MPNKKVRRTVQIDNSNISYKLDAVFKTRWHGATNIRGIRYQILYSLLRAFELYKDESTSSSLRLEGIEDVDVLDLIGLKYQNEYIQVKSSDEPWSWRQLIGSPSNRRGPLVSFLKTAKIDSDSRFVLAVNFPLTGDIEKLSRLKSLPFQEKRRVENSFYRLCADVGATDIEAKDLLDRLSIISVPEEQIWKELRIVITNVFKLGSNAVDTYIGTLTARFLKWAEDRKTIVRSDLENVRSDIGEALSRETEFQAFGRSWIDRIAWVQDENLTDFFDGKGTRSGHVVADLDIRRPIWLEQIDTALTASKICILRASSGQGKSTLLYRYAYEKWSHENTFILRVAETSEQAEQIRNYLQFRTKLGVPILLLIDDIKWQTQLWASVAQECTALGIRVLVTVRDEDWHRFGQESLISYEILEPRLDLEEAKQIFKSLRNQGRLHQAATSPEWAYERIGEPHLLMEYVHLLTQGQMLEERLRDQIKQISRQCEDPAKLEILRRVSLAHALGTPVLIDQLLQNITFRDDPQQMLQSLLGEYLQLESRMVTGLHWVRSNLLSQILHEGFLNPAITALKIVEAIPLKSLASFISSAICRQELDSEAFLSGLIDKARKVDIETLLVILDGIFEAGEQRFFDVNQSLFDEAYKSFGSQVPFLLSMNTTPVIKDNTLSELNKKLSGQSASFHEFCSIESKIVHIPRGLDLCSSFLSDVVSSSNLSISRANLDSVGRLLDWCALCQTNIPNWTAIKERLITDTRVFQLPLQSFCNFTQGIYRYDESAYREWFLDNQEEVFSYIKLNNDCIKLEFFDNTVYIEFFPDAKEVSTIYEETKLRLSYLRSAIPFCKSYRSRGIWLLPYNLEPSYDETYRDIERKYLPFKSDVSKNGIWFKIVQKNYLPDSYYKYEEVWYFTRKNALLLVQVLVKTLEKSFSGRQISSNAFSEISELLIKTEEQLRHIPSISVEELEAISSHISSSLKEVFSQKLSSKWSNSFSNFVQQLIRYIGNKNSSLGESVLHSFNEANKALLGMHTEFERLFQEAPDYFGAAELNLQEINAYSILVDLLEVWILNQLSYFTNDVRQYIQADKSSKRNELFRRLEETLAPLHSLGIAVTLPSGIYTDYPLRYLPIVFSVADPCCPELELSVILAASTEILDVTDFFCLIPIFQGKRFLEGGYQISSTRITELLQGCLEFWETFIPYKLPEDIWNFLPGVEFCLHPRRQFRTGMYGLLASLEVLIKRKQIIDSLEKSQNFFEVELYERHRSRLSTLVEILVDTVTQVKSYLISDFFMQKNKFSYRIIKDFLDTLEEGLRQKRLDDVLVPYPENMRNTVDELLQG